jgi:hypothetical protein
VSRKELKANGAWRLVANAAQLSLRDLRYRPLRAVVQPKEAPVESELEKALLAYVESVDSELK